VRCDGESEMCFENNVLRKIFGRRGGELQKDGEYYLKELQYALSLIALGLFSRWG
jgi:hypothetical protein